MFTGIVDDIGMVSCVAGNAQGRTFTIQTAYDFKTIRLGDSIACAGVCMTVVHVDARNDKSKGGVFRVEATKETLACTTAGLWQQGDSVNLERSLRVGDSLDGHFVSGHVDGITPVESLLSAGNGRNVRLGLPELLRPFIVLKGSVCLDGVSLTVNAIENDCFSVTLIPHTWKHTSWCGKSVGDMVNIEVDMLARYVRSKL